MVWGNVWARTYDSSMLNTLYTHNLFDHHWSLNEEIPKQQRSMCVNHSQQSVILTDRNFPNIKFHIIEFNSEKFVYDVLHTYRALETIHRYRMVFYHRHWVNCVQPYRSDGRLLNSIMITIRSLIWNFAEVAGVFHERSNKIVKNKRHNYHEMRKLMIYNTPSITISPLIIYDTLCVLLLC